MHLPRLFSVAIVLLLTTVTGTAYEEVEDGLLESRQAFFTGVGGAVRFRNIEPLFPTVEIQAGKTSWQLPASSSKDIAGLSYNSMGEQHTLESFLRDNRTNALLVLQSGEIVAEIYRNGAQASDRFLSFSTGKSITSTLLGMALDDGLIDSVDDRVSKYLPKMSTGAFKDVTLRDILQMASGADFSEEYAPPPEAGPDWQSQFDIALNETLFGQRQRFSDYAAQLAPKHTPGTVFSYSTFDTGVIAAVVTAASGMPFNTYFENRFWRPLGAEADAAMLLDGPPGVGEPLAGGGYLLTLRDYGRFGQMVLNGGKANGQQLVSTQWLATATRPDPDRPFLHPPKLEDGTGYQHQWWLFEDGTFTAEGVFGQYVYVDPKSDLVIVKLSYWEDAWNPAYALESKAFFDAVANHLRR